MYNLCETEAIYLRERIYTIPVNEAFEQSGDGCPFCLLRRRLEESELDLILGASMMEPDIRIKTNELGFCHRHFSKMLTMKNRLGMALMLQSHISELKEQIEPGGMFAKDIGAKPSARIAGLERSCYVCARVEDKLSKMLATAAFLYAEESDFQTKLKGKKMFCLPHYKALADASSRSQPKKVHSILVKDLHAIVGAYLADLESDIALFCRKFDYRFDDEPWGSSKDSIERAIAFLKGNYF